MEKNNFDIILDKMRELYNKKNSDYGSSFDKTYEQFGLISSLVRMNDKINRLNNLVKSNNVKVNESISDTLLDLANYCVMTLIKLEKYEF